MAQNDIGRGGIDMEIWKDIEGYEGLYQISSKGRVKSFRNNKGVERQKILKLNMDSRGYLRVCLVKNKTKRTYSVHRLVAKHFIENPYNLDIVNHIDENPTNNEVNNLEWCNTRYNINYGNCKKKIGRANSLSIKCLTTGETFESISSACRKYKLSSGNLVATLKKERGYCGKDSLTGEKLYWEYAKEEQEMKEKEILEEKLVRKINSSFDFHCSNTECKDCDYLEYRGVGMCKMAYLASLLGEEIEIDSWKNK